MFAKHALQKVLQKRLPRFDRPLCQADDCRVPLDEPRPISVEGKEGEPLKVHCLARCSTCGAQYKGERMISVGRKGSKAIQQDFHPYNDEDRAFVNSLLPAFQQNQAEIQQINAQPVRD